MTDTPPNFSHDPDEPLGLVHRVVAPPSAWSDLRAIRFEFSSRGDRVAGRLLIPGEGEPPFPLVLLQHGIGGAKDADYLDAACGPWVRAGAAVASIDFPLHGDRASTKLTEHLLGALRDPASIDAETLLLAHEFFHQAVVDLQRALNALERLPVVDAKRVVYAGFSLGTIVGATFCGIDPRPCAAAFAIGGGGSGPAALDPARHVGRFAPRPALFVNATRDEVVSREAAEALFAGAGEPKEMLWFEGTHTELPGAALKAMWQFLRRHLELS